MNDHTLMMAFWILRDKAPPNSSQPFNFISIIQILKIQFQRHLE
jgi:hypothetical protein